MRHGRRRFGFPGGNDGCFPTKCDTTIPMLKGREIKKWGVHAEILMVDRHWLVMGGIKPSMQLMKRYSCCCGHFSSGKKANRQILSFSRLLITNNWLVSISVEESQILTSCTAISRNAISRNICLVTEI